MESLIIAGLTGLAGYYLQDKYNRNVDEQNHIMLENEKPNSMNIYSGNKVNISNNEVLEKSLLNYKKSETPSISGVLPPIYNSYSVVGDDTLLHSNVPEQNLVQVNEVNRRGDILETKEVKLSDRPMFKSPQLGMSTKDVFANFGSGLTTNQEVSLLSGQPINREHSNMIPFFGSNIKQNVETFINESKFDSLTGNSSTFIPKQAPLPKFEQTAQNIYGGPLLTDHVDTSRFIPSRYRQNEKPFYEEKVTAPKAGTLDNPLNNIPQLTIDSLRTANNQQVSYEGRTKAGQMGSVRGIASDVMKNRPDTHFELGKDRFFKSTGAFLASKPAENFDNFQKTSRQNQNIEYYGGALYKESLLNGPRLKEIDNTDKLDFNSIVQKSKRNQFNSDFQRNIGSQINAVDDYGKKSINLPELERESTNAAHTLNIHKGSSGHKIAIQNDVKNTIKETLLGKHDNTGNIRTNVINKNKNTDITDYNSKTTQKETLIHNKYKGQANKKDGMGYTVVNPTAKTTNKEITSDIPYSGHVNDKNKNNMIYSTFENPEKVRNAVHIENYKGSGKYSTSAAENRKQFDNAEITDRKETLLQGQRPNGRKSTLGSISNNSLGETKLTANMLLKEKEKTRKENVNIGTNSVILSKGLIGQQRQVYNNHSELENDRLNTNDISLQLSSNPFYNLR